MSESSQVSETLNDAERSALALKARAATLDVLRGRAGEARVDAIRDRALATADFSARELAQPSPRKAFPRLVEFELWQALAELQREGLVESVPPAHWRLAPAGARTSELRAMAYVEYLQTPEWLRARADALDRAGHCAVEERHTERLEVYHRSTERLGAEREEDLVVLCDGCYVLWQHAYGIVRVAEPVTAKAELESAPRVVAKRALRMRLLPR